jgi:hypothetical protein
MSYVHSEDAMCVLASVAAVAVLPSGYTKDLFILLGIGCALLSQWGSAEYARRNANTLRDHIEERLQKLEGDRVVNGKHYRIVRNICNNGDIDGDLGVHIRVGDQLRNVPPAQPSEGAGGGPVQNGDGVRNDGSDVNHGEVQRV